MAAAVVDKNDERRKRVFVGTLPNDFLRLHPVAPASDHEQQEAADAQAAMALQQQMVGPQNPTVGRLNLTIVQAKLAKNYGMTRMDPYVRVRVGHCVYETATDNNGGKTPKWDRDIHCLLAQGVSSIYVEIFDECSFTMDELIAWTQISIPQSIFKGEVHEDWYPLSGKQGDGLEGMISIVMSFSPGGAYGYYPIPAPLLAIPGSNYGLKTYRQLPVSYSAPAPPISVISAPPVPQPSAEDLKQIEDMFPNMDKEVVRSVYEANRYRKEFTVNSLLQMNE